jgi:hypothetical protein
MNWISRLFLLLASNADRFFRRMMVLETRVGLVFLLLMLVLSFSTAAQGRTRAKDRAPSYEVAASSEDAMGQTIQDEKQGLKNGSSQGKPASKRTLETASSRAMFEPLRIEAPSPSSAQARRKAAPEIIERDPFEVSPRLRELPPAAPRHGATDGAPLGQNMRLRAVVRTPAGSVAKIESSNLSMTVRDGDELDIGGIRYQVTVEAESVMLRGVSSPQYRMQIK